MDTTEIVKLSGSNIELIDQIKEYNSLIETKNEELRKARIDENESTVIRLEFEIKGLESLINEKETQIEDNMSKMKNYVREQPSSKQG